MPAESDALIPVRKRIVSVHVDKPNRTSWWIAHPGYQFIAGILTDKGAGREEQYLVTPELAASLGDDVRLMRLHGAMTREGDFFIIPVRLPSPDGRVDEWTASRARAAELAAERPIRMASNVRAGTYEVFTTSMEIKFPDWPEESWEDLIEIAFRDKMIDSDDHPVLKRLRGEF